LSLQQFFDTAIQELNRSASLPLGDRSLYIGASDIGNCPRKVVLGKRQPVTHDTRTLLRFSRGHLVEDLLANIFTAGGARFEREAETVHPNEPFRAHLDFLFGERRGRTPLHILEVKSVSGIPGEPYPSWVDQLYFQIGMLTEAHPGRRVTGSILSLDLNAGEYREFDEFAHQEGIYSILLDKGRHMASALRGETEPRTETGVLCGFCDQRGDCPAFSCDSVSIPADVADLAERYLVTNTTKGEAEKELKQIKEQIVAFTGGRFRGQTDEFAIIVATVAPSETVDTKLLQAKHPDIYAEVLKPKAGFTKLEVREVRKAA
jgi:CRISPR-associated exonuclease Cas4